MGCSGSKVDATTANNLFCLSCIDGRTTETIKGCPGGDAGVLFRCLYAAKQVSPDTQGLNDDSKIKKIIIDTTVKLKHIFYYHTDDHAAHHFDPTKISDFSEAAKGENIGCGYLKLCCTAPGELDEDDNLSEYAKFYVSALTKAYTENKKVFDYVVLKGDHAEEQVKLFNGTKPYKADGKTFIYHPNVENTDGHKILEVIYQDIPELASKKDEISQKFQEICKRHWEKTINYLAPGKEIQKMD